MVSKSGIKVLDFGLARSAEDETLSASAMVIGTPAYMAPEQLQGGTIDARTDTYALGLVLYEMAIGKRPAQQQSLSMPALPRELAHIIERCLAPDPNEPWQAASDVRAELEWAAAASKSAGEVRSSKSRWPWFVAAVCAVASIRGLDSVFAAERSRQRLVLLHRRPAALANRYVQHGEISPD